MSPTVRASRAVHRLSRAEARRIAIRAQLLDAERPTDLVAMVEHLMFVQIDPTAAVAPTADLVAWSRLGDRYDPSDMHRALEEDRTLYEVVPEASQLEPGVAMVRPTSHLGLYLADMGAAPQYWHRREWFEANEGFRLRVLELLRSSGPLLSRDIPDTCERPWGSTGWTNDRNVTQMLGLLLARGEIAIAGRRGRQRLWDVADRVYPANVEVLPPDEARRIRNEKRLRSLGLARPRLVEDAGEAVRVEGTKGLWRVDVDATAEGFEGRTALLSPFDRLIHDRKRALEVFDFEFTLEIYKPKEQRRWGFFALPVLHNDQLVGKVDATTDREASVLRVHAIHEDVAFTRKVTSAVKAELRALAQWLGVDKAIFE